MAALQTAEMILEDAQLNLEECESRGGVDKLWAAEVKACRVVMRAAALIVDARCRLRPESPELKKLAWLLKQIDVAQLERAINEVETSRGS